MVGGVLCTKLLTGLFMQNKAVPNGPELRERNQRHHKFSGTDVQVTSGLGPLALSMEARRRMETYLEQQPTATVLGNVKGGCPGGPLQPKADYCPSWGDRRHGKGDQ